MMIPDYLMHSKEGSRQPAIKQDYPLSAFLNLEPKLLLHS